MGYVSWDVTPYGCVLTYDSPPGKGKIFGLSYLEVPRDDRNERARCSSHLDVQRVRMKLEVTTEGLFAERIAEMERDGIKRDGTNLCDLNSSRGKV